MNAKIAFIWIIVLTLSISASYAGVICGSDLSLNTTNLNPNQDDTFKIHLWYTDPVLGIFELSSYANATLQLPTGLTNLDSSNDGSLAGTNEEWNVNASLIGDYLVNASVFYNNGTIVDCNSLSINVSSAIQPPFFNITIPDVADNLLINQNYNIDVVFENSGNGNGTIVGTIGHPKVNFTDNSFSVFVENGSSTTQSFTFTPIANGSDYLTVSILNIQDSGSNDLTPLTSFYSANNDSFTVNGTLCAENWQCSAWNTCLSDGTQTRACSDSNNCGTVTSRPSLSQTCDYTSGGSNGGSSGGSQSPQQSRSWSSINANDPVIMKVSKSAIAVKELEINTINDVKNVNIKIEKVYTLPQSMQNSTPSKVFQYFLIVNQNIDDEDIDSAKFRFEVLKSWIDGENLTNDDIVLKRYHDKVWNDLVTSMISEDSSNVNFEAVTPGFSYFAIGTKEVVEEIKEVKEDVIEEEKSKVVEEELEEQIPEKEGVVENENLNNKSEEEFVVEEEKHSKLPLVIMVIVVLILASVIFVYTRNSEDKK